MKRVGDTILLASRKNIFAMLTRNVSLRMFRQKKTMEIKRRLDEEAPGGVRVSDTLALHNRDDMRHRFRKAKNAVCRR